MKVIIKQISGSLAGTEQVLDLQGRDVLTIGRDPAAKLAFDPKDDIVSREHASLSQDANDPSYVALSDTKSRNGTFVNGKRVSGTVRLQPGDKVQLGAGGPEFSVDTDPRPAAGLAPTREQSVMPAPTREADLIKTGTSAPSSTSNRPVQKVGVGKETFESTVVKLKSEGRRGVVTAIAVGIVAVAVVASALVYQSSQSNAKITGKLNATNAALGTAQEKLANAPLSAADVKGKMGKAVVYVECTFGLEDKPSGKAIMTTSYRDPSGQDMFVFMKTTNPKFPYVPLLLTDVSQLKATGQTLGSGASGSGFAVSGNGFILTNRHVVEPWVVPLQWPVRGVAFDPTSGGLIVDASTHKILVGDFGATLNTSGWNPTQDQAYYQGGVKVRFLDKVVDLPQVAGRRLSLQVTLSGNSNPFNADVARISDDADVALIRVASPEALSTAELNDNYDTVDVGKVWVLGFPGASVPSFVVKQSQAKYFGESGTAHMLADPDTAAGQLTRVIRPKTEKPNKPMGKEIVNPAYGDVYELSVPGVGHGNSGGPVTDDQGKVIGILTLGLDQGPTLQYAVPIRYGKELISNSSS